MQTYVNPISGGQDPYFMKGPDGLYYSVFGGGNRSTSIYVAQSDRLSEPGVAHLVWTAKDGCWNSGTIWAPEIHYLRGKWYIYYTSAVTDCGVAGWTTRKLGVLKSDHPLGPYADAGKLELGDDMSIDGSVLEMPDGRLYFVYMRNKRFEDQMNTICIAPMENPEKICGEPVMISHPTFPWEEFVNEGPEALIHDGKVMIVYSAHAAHTPEYCLAILECANPDDPMDRASWIKHTSPVFSKGNGVFGPGHASMTVSPDDSTPYLVYHCKSNGNSTFGVPGSMDRMICVQPFTWSEDGYPKFGEPIPTGKPMPLPKGEKEDGQGDFIENAISDKNEYLISYSGKEYLTIVENILYLNGIEKPEFGCKAVIRGIRWDDVSVDVDMRMPGGDCAGVILRGTNIGARKYLMNGYVAALSPRFGLELLRVDRTMPVRLAYAPVRAGQGDWVHMKVNAVGNRITVEVCGTKLEVYDDIYISGRVGMIADGDLAWFRNMRVEGLKNESDNT